MCGIAGVLGPGLNQNEALQKLRKINHSMFHRGPDSEGFFQAPGVSLSMRRLSIIDLTGGSQPLISEDGTTVLICNGEIYNFVELRNELESEGVRFQTHSDCETILHLYRRDGVASFTRLRGMYAFALYDKSKNQVILGRDRMGERPLYYAHHKGSLFFASEMKSIVEALGPGALSLSPESAVEFLTFQYVHEPRTLFKEVQKLPAGTFAVVDLKEAQLSIQPKAYWSYLEAPKVSGKPEELVRRSLEDAVTIMMRSDVPIALSLSGGIDSSLIAAIVRKKTNADLKAFSVGYTGRPENDERHLAKGLAQKLGIEFYDVELSAGDFVKQFPKLVWDMDDPIGDIAAFGYWSVNQLAHKNGIRVLLSGLGADELFWGYSWVRDAAKASRKKSFLKSVLGSFADKILSHPERPVFFEKLDWLPVSAQQCYSILHPSQQRRTGRAENIWQSCEANPDWNEIVLWLLDLHNRTWLQSNCLALGDRMGMAHSIETRLPFMDHVLTDTVTGLRKSGMKDESWGHKTLLKKACGDLLPDEILNRPKRGFTPPTATWMEQAKAKYAHLLENGCLVQNSIVTSTGAMNILKNGDGTGLGYRLILLEIWCRLYLQKEQISALTPTMDIGASQLRPTGSLRDDAL
ncbi:MAG: asparagine synthase (glutamine-hydrolyzing) [Bdellovibrionales bacterium]|nr:asparagine synthase (glutamine-hydrolyzing) [Bdellovibrionales bacterium]